MAKLKFLRANTIPGMFIAITVNALLWLVAVNLASTISTVKISHAVEIAVHVVFGLTRVLIVFYAGYLVVQQNRKGLWAAAGVGALLLFLDHPVIGGGIFLVQGETQAFQGVLISYIMFVWVPMLIAVLGGMYARRRVLAAK